MFSASESVRDTIPKSNNAYYLQPDRREYILAKLIQYLGSTIPFSAAKFTTAKLAVAGGRKA